MCALLAALLCCFWSWQHNQSSSATDRADRAVCCLLSSAHTEATATKVQVLILNVQPLCANVPEGIPLYLKLLSGWALIQSLVSSLRRSIMPHILVSFVYMH